MRLFAEGLGKARRHQATPKVAAASKVIAALPVLLGLGLTLLLSTANSFAQPAIAPEEWNRYAAAIEDSIIIQATERHKLQPLVFAAAPEDPGGERRATVVSWVRRGAYKVGDNAAKTELWVVQLSEIKSALQKIPANIPGKAIALRIAQLLGLPPDAGLKPANAYQEFVTLAIPESAARAGAIFRPAPDPSPLSDSLAIDPRMVGELPRPDGTPLYPVKYAGWLAGNLLSFPPSVSGAHLQWFSNNLLQSYKTTEGRFDGYPWTRLGYTFDWSVKSTKHSEEEENALEYGLSEYVMQQGTSLLVLKVQSTEDFFKAAH